MGKKVPSTSPSSFDHFAGHLRRLYLVVCCNEFYLYSFGVGFFPSFFIDEVCSFC